MEYEERIAKLDLCIKFWFEKTGKSEARPKDLMEHLIECKIYPNDDPKRSGKRLRNDLRNLLSENRLDIITTLDPVYTKSTTQWYFKRGLKK